MKYFERYTEYYVSIDTRAPYSLQGSLASEEQSKHFKSIVAQRYRHMCVTSHQATRAVLFAAFCDKTLALRDIPEFCGEELLLRS